MAGCEGKLAEYWRMRDRIGGWVAECEMGCGWVAECEEELADYWRNVSGVGGRVAG